MGAECDAAHGGEIRIAPQHSLTHILRGEIDLTKHLITSRRGAIVVVGSLLLASCVTKPGPDSSNVQDLSKIVGQKLPPNIYPFRVRTRTVVDIEMVSGGGGGGGASDHYDSWAGSGEGGKSGEYIFKRHELIAGDYILTVGAKGVGGVSKGRTNRASDGQAGGDTILAASSQLPLTYLKGGAGGKADGTKGQPESRGGNGQSLMKSSPQAVIGKGGKGGVWMQNGQHASGNGAGGGGLGGVRLPKKRGGNGSDGFARLTVIRN
jgi:hypothetical protein